MFMCKPYQNFAPIFGCGNHRVQKVVIRPLIFLYLTKESLFLFSLANLRGNKCRELDISALTDEQFECLATLTNVWNLTGRTQATSTGSLPSLFVVVWLFLDPIFPLKLECDNLRILEIEQRDQSWAGPGPGSGWTGPISMGS